MYLLSRREPLAEAEAEAVAEEIPEDIEFSLFGGGSSVAPTPFATSIEFKEIVDLLNELTAQTKAIKTGYSKLQRSKKTDKTKTSTQWSMVALAGLVYNLKQAEATWKSWKNSPRLLNLASKAALNPVAWNTQYKISMVANKIIKQKADMFRKLDPFFRNGEFVKSALYVDDNWSILPNSGDGAEIIVNKSKPDVSYVLGTDWKYQIEVGDDEDV